MKSIALGLLASLILFGGLPDPAHAKCLDPPADLNADGTTDILDVVCNTLAVLWELGGKTDPAPTCLEVSVSEADVSCDESTNVADILLTIKTALGITWSPIIDLNADFCADRCFHTVRGGVFGGGFVVGADDSVLTLEATVATPNIIGTTSDGTYILQSGNPDKK